jgi:tetratricopeptide (TPR) repeat protein
VIRGGPYRERAMTQVVSIVGRLGARKGCRRARTPMTARAWYDHGVALEAGGDVAAACDAYRSTLARDAAVRDGVRGDASCNLGRLLHDAGDLDGAERCYRAALEADPAIAIYWFNLGVALEDRGDRAGAAGCYREALARDGRLADAHFNLARLCEQAGDLASSREAIRHWQAYRALRRSA